MKWGMDGLWDIGKGYCRRQGRDEGRLRGRNGGRTHEREGDYCKNVESMEGGVMKDSGEL
jgi:hypothetical protein